MRLSRAAFLVVFSLVPQFAVAQQSTQPMASSNPQAIALLRQSLAALTGGQLITNVTLSGTARRIAGSDDESGTAVFKAVASGAARIDLTLPSGARNEIANLTGASPAGSRSGPDGVPHEIAYHNLLTEPAWFFPAFAISRRLSDSSFVATYVGQETHDGQAVQHVSVSQAPPFPDPPGVPTHAHLTQVDFFFDTTTLLPTAITFNIHPDNNVLRDLPVEIRFSDYRSVAAGFNPTSSPQVAFHIQKLLNNSLILDFQAQAVFHNANLSTRTFVVGAGR